jgi:hypothetical protein
MTNKVTKAKAIIVALLILKHRKQALFGTLFVCSSALVSMTRTFFKQYRHLSWSKVKNIVGWYYNVLMV